MRKLLKVMMFLLLRIVLIDVHVLKDTEIRVFYFSGILTWRRWVVAERKEPDAESRERIKKRFPYVRILEFSSDSGYEDFLKAEHPLLPRPEKWNNFRIDFRFWYLPAEIPSNGYNVSI